MGKVCKVRACKAQACKAFTRVVPNNLAPLATAWETKPLCETLAASATIEKETFQMVFSEAFGKRTSQCA